MKVKTISSILRKKHNALLDSITDEKVRGLMEKNTIITGGCIVSMLLGEEVNDYDMYFTDKETVMAVANYYAEQFRKTHSESNVTVTDEEGRVRIWIQSAGVAAEEDYTEEAPEDDNETPQEVEQEKPKYRPVYLTSNAITLSDKVQLIIRFYGDAKEIHTNYDFVHCTNYWESSTGILSTPVVALQAILAKELVYQGSKYPLASVIRTRKFINRGWNINAGQYLKMCMQISDLDLHNADVLEDQLVGVDMAYFRSIINGIREKQEEDPFFKLSTEYVCEIIDRVF